MQPLTFKPPFQILDVRLVGDRRKWEGRCARRFCRVVSGFAVNEEHLFSTTIVGLELVILHGPRVRNSLFMLQFLKVLFSEAGQGRAVHLRVAAHEIMDSRCKRMSRIVKPLLFWLVPFFSENCLG